MNYEDKFWLGFWAIVFSFLAIVIIGCTLIVCRHTQKMANLGYQEVMVVGSSTTVWQKAK